MQPLLTKRMGRPVEVVNLAITGHGPDQYAGVARPHFPRLRPELVLVASFINDFEDATIPTPVFHQMIGFPAGDPTGLRARLRPLHLRAWFTLHPWETLRAAISGLPGASAAAYSGLKWLRTDAPFWASTGRVAERFAEIDVAAKDVGAQVELVQIPAAFQVCEDLPYLRRPVDLAAYDLERPQATQARIARSLGWRVRDLRPALRGLGACPCQPANLHFTRAGHRAVAEALYK